MNAQDCLTLRTVRLNAAEESLIQRQHLHLVAPTLGAGRYDAGAHSIRLAVGEVLVVNSASDGKISALRGGEFVFWSFSVGFENLLPLVGAHEVRLLQRVIDDFKQPKVYSASSALALESHQLLSEVPPQRDFGHRIQLLQIVFGVLCEEFRNLQQGRPGFAGPEEHLVKIFENLSLPELLNLSVGELATRFCCSRRHLNRLFHQYFGLSVADLKMEMRLIKAVSLLRNSDSKVINVAEECGFNHQGLFYACFKKRFGSTPGQWRKAGDRADAPGPCLTENNDLRTLRAKDLYRLVNQAERDTFSASIPSNRVQPRSATPSSHSQIRRQNPTSPTMILESRTNGDSLRRPAPLQILKHA